MGCDYHPVPGHELLRHGGLIRARFIDMHYQFSKMSTSTSIPPFRQPCQNFPHIIPRVQFAPTIEGVHHCKPGQTSHESEHHFVGLNCAMFPIWIFPIRRKHDEFMVCNGIEPWLIQHHDVVPVSSLVSCVQYRQKGPGTLDACSLLIGRQNMWHSSKMAGDKPKFLRESIVYRGY
jgi:hypothetical protein